MFVPLLGKDKGFACKENPMSGQHFSHFGTSMLSSDVVHRLLLHALCWLFLGSTKYILVDLAFVVRASQTLLCGNLTSCYSVPHPLPEPPGLHSMS